MEELLGLVGSHSHSRSHSHGNDDAGDDNDIGIDDDDDIGSDGIDNGEEARGQDHRRKQDDCHHNKHRRPKMSFTPRSDTPQPFTPSRVVI